MANLIKINFIQFYVGFDIPENVNECFACKKFLDAEKIPYVLMAHMEDKNYPELFDTLSSWVFDTDYKTHVFTGFPIITWHETYDNYDVVTNVAKSLDELRNSRLILNKNLIL
jgi:hypothetical protein